MRLIYVKDVRGTTSLFEAPAQHHDSTEKSSAENGD